MYWDEWIKKPTKPDLDSFVYRLQRKADLAFLPTMINGEDMEPTKIQVWANLQKAPVKIWWGEIRTICTTLIVTISFNLQNAGIPGCKHFYFCKHYRSALLKQLKCCLWCQPTLWGFKNSKMFCSFESCPSLLKESNNVTTHPVDWTVPWPFKQGGHTN